MSLKQNFRADDSFGALSVLALLLFFPVFAFGATFTNPIGDGADPWVIYWNGYYYWSSSNGSACWVSKAQKLQDIARVTKINVWTPPQSTSYSRELWAPELHYVQGKWYIYVAADNGQNENHRMYVLEGTTQNPQDTFVFKAKLNAVTDRWAIDGTMFERNDGKMYFIWSGWDSTVNIRQNLYIAEMSNPWTISGERVLISSPEYPWEQLGGTPSINEGPEVLEHNGDIFIIYSASGSWCDDYCLGQLKFTGGTILDKNSWTKKSTAVFSKTATVFGPGHCSFVKSPDGTEDWIVYHAAKYSGAGWNRNIRIQRFTWNSDGTPFFGTPVTEGIALEEPSNIISGIVRSSPVKHRADVRQNSVSSIYYTLQGRIISPAGSQNTGAGMHITAGNRYPVIRLHK